MVKNLIFIFLFLSQVSFAIEVDEIIPEPKKEDLIFNNEFDNVLAPFTSQSSLITLGGLFATYVVYKDSLETSRAKNFNERKESKPWRSTADTLGWGILPATYAGIMAYNYYSGDKKEKNESLRNSEYLIKSVVYTALTTFAMKLSINQGRPKDRLKKDSFPSGHASSSFAFSTAIWMLHGPYWGSFATAVAGVVTYSRIDDGSHYYHDSIFGAALGISYAIGIYNNHFKRDLPFTFAFLPGPRGDGMGGLVSYEF